MIKKYLDTTWFENYELTPQKEGYRQVYCKKKKKKNQVLLASFYFFTT